MSLHSPNLYLEVHVYNDKDQSATSGSKVLENLLFIGMSLLKIKSFVEIKATENHPIYETTDSRYHINW